MAKLNNIGKLINIKMTKKINTTYKNEVLLDDEHRFTVKFFELMSEIFLEIIEDAKKNESKNKK